MVSTTTTRGSDAGERATYVYGLVEHKRAPSVVALPPGLDGIGPIRCVKVKDGRFLVVADAPLARYGEAAIAAGLQDLDWVSACAVAHEGVLEGLLGGVQKGAALLPMKLFTLFFDDESALAHVRAQEAEIDAVVARLKGCVEMGVRVTARPAATSTPRAAPESGAAFLRMKKEQRDQRKNALEEGRAVARALFEEIARGAEQHKERELPAEGSKLLLDGVLLMKERAAMQLFDDIAAREREHAERGVAVVVTGPWPPYHFVGGAR